MLVVLRYFSTFIVPNHTSFPPDTTRNWWTEEVKHRVYVSFFKKRSGDFEEPSFSVVMVIRSILITSYTECSYDNQRNNSSSWLSYIHFWQPWQSFFVLVVIGTCWVSAILIYTDNHDNEKQTFSYFTQFWRRRDEK